MSFHKPSLTDDPSRDKPVVIIGAGPAGLTAALELIRRSGGKPIVLEALDDVGGISRTIEFKGNRMDIGGHRFFSKSDWVMDWWRSIVPLPELDGSSDKLLGVVPKQERVMLLRNRLSRIYFLRRFFDYPISLSGRTMRNLGAWRLCKIGVAYAHATVRQRRPERHLEDFFINRFGRELYKTFFKGYTEKVWGVRCTDISPEWGAQRVKGLSVSRTLLHAARKRLAPGKYRSIGQKTTETSLIDRFLYPKYGPGQMWRIVAEQVEKGGGEVRLGVKVTGIEYQDGKVVSVRYTDAQGESHALPCRAVISSMPVKDLIQGLLPPPPKEVRDVAEGLAYRDFITVGLLLRKLKPSRYTASHANNLLPDTWIYIQEPDVKLGRLQIFNNWSPALVRDPDTVWLGLEYFCFEGDELWRLDDGAMAALAADELEKVGIIDRADVLDAHVVRVPKAYPAYFGTYDRFDELRRWTDLLSNLYLVGRNGMHRYNNQDHSMLTARAAVSDLMAGCVSKDGLWEVNAEDEYHEEKAGKSD